MIAFSKMRRVFVISAFSSIAFGGTTLIDTPTQLKRLPAFDIRTYGAKCDGTTDDTAAFSAVEALTTDNRDVYLPPGDCKITTSPTTLTKKYAGPGRIKVGTTGYYAPQFHTINSMPATGVDNDYFAGDVSHHARAAWWTIPASIQDQYSTLSSTYYQWQTYPDFFRYTINAGRTGTDARLSATSTSGQKVLYLLHTEVFTAGQQIQISGTAGAETNTIASIQAGISLTMTTNLAHTYVKGENVALGMRTNAAISMEILDANGNGSEGGGDMYAHFFRIYPNCTPAAGQTHFSSTCTVGWYGGDIVGSGAGNYVQESEINTSDQDNDQAVIARVRNYTKNDARRSWIAQVNHDSASGQNKLYVTSNFSWALDQAISQSKMLVRIGNGTVRDETLTMSTTGTDGTGYYIQFTGNLAYNHTAVQADWISTSTYSTVWIHDHTQVQGSQPIDVWLNLNGYARRGIDMSHAVFSLDSQQAAVVLAQNQRIYLDHAAADDSADEAGYDLWSHIPGSSWISYNSGLSEIEQVVGSAVITAANSTGLFTGTGKHLVSGASVAVASGSSLYLNGLSGNSSIVYSPGLTAMLFNVAGTNAFSLDQVAAYTNTGIRLSLGGNAEISTNNKLCLNGVTCSTYLFYNGTNVKLFKGGVEVGSW